MRKIIRLTERDLTKLVKRVLTERRRDFNEVLEMVESIEQHFDSFFENVLSKRTDEFEKHPDFPLEYIIRFVLSTIKENPNLAERMYNQDYYIFYDTILTRPAHTVSSWLNLYCFMNYEMRLKDPEICKYPEDVDWEIVKKETNKEVNVVNNNNIKLTPPKTPNVKTIRKNTERPKIPDGNGKDYKLDFNRYNINIYSTYEDMLKFMSEFEPYVESLKPKDLICSDEIMRILIILSETLQKKIESLQNKYRYNKSPEKSSTSDTDDEKINDFIKKYGGYNKEIFYDLAKKFADDINIPYQLVTNKYDEKYKKILSNVFNVGYDETKLNQDSEYIKAKELRKKVNYYIECCDNGRWICDDPPPPPFYPPRDDYDYKYNKITIDYNPTTKGGGPSTTNDKSGSKDREMREQIRRTLRKLL